jgi:hypothetical protein
MMLLNVVAMIFFGCGPLFVGMDERLMIDGPGRGRKEAKHKVFLQF